MPLSVIQSVSHSRGDGSRERRLSLIIWSQKANTRGLLRFDMIQHMLEIPRVRVDDREARPIYSLL